MRFLKRLFLILIILVAAVYVTGYFVLRQPQFGSTPEGAYLTELSASPQHNGSVFVNDGNVDMDFGLTQIWEGLKGYMNLPEGMEPDSLPILHPDLNQVNAPSEGYHLTWFGHSAFLLEVGDKNILLDPMLGPAAAPFSFQVNRYSNDLPIAIEDLPHINAVIFSHDHYDHLDYPTVIGIKGKVDHFYVPLGLKGHLVHWGVDSNKVTELDWWDEIRVDDMMFACTPAQHFSGRGLSDRGATLWCSWVIKTPKRNIYFSGDSGYFGGFKKIGEKYGPFDIAMLECGQYNILWKPIHMMPEETAQAALDLGAQKMIPIHWGMFTLGLHPWKEPAERVSLAAQELGVDLVTPKIGARFALGDTILTEAWWQEF